MPIYAAEETVTRKEKINRLLRASFRSYAGLRKTVKKDFLSELMGYDMEIRAQKTKHISEQKWKHRLMGTTYHIETDTSPIVRQQKPLNICKGIPKAIIKHINIQTSLCAACKVKDIKRQGNIDHLNKAHNCKFRTTKEIMKEIRGKVEAIKKQAKREQKKPPKRTILLDSAEKEIQPEINKLKLFQYT